jgi:RNA-binding protein
MSGLTAGKRRFVKRCLGDAKPTVWVGKDGVSEEVLREVLKQLAVNRMVKVRVLAAGLKGDDAKAIAVRVAEGTGSVLVEVRGHTFMLYKKREQ